MELNKDDNTDQAKWIGKAYIMEYKQLRNDGDGWDCLPQAGAYQLFRANHSALKTFIQVRLYGINRLYLDT